MATGKDTRRNCHGVEISSGSVTNIIKSWLKGLDSTECSAARDLAVQFRKCGMNLKECAETFRLKNLLKRGGESGLL